MKENLKKLLQIFIVNPQKALETLSVSKPNLYRIFGVWGGGSTFLFTIVLIFLVQQLQLLNAYWIIS